ncbi:hypothetical protein Scep_002142 [Stephania cephalantha]|uniref:AB hydrolase-1 domain-containing protein n=1 Tax=Stephania cephalantha TaxID=152367 RepID=A0AAP0L9Q8_9MAGN
MARCFSLTASRDRFYRYTYAQSGLRSISTDLGDGGTVMHCWVPKAHRPSKPTLLLLHGFGANAMWQWSDLLRPFASRCNLYIPDLLFFGDSYTSLPDRSEAFQARCVMRLLEARGVAGRLTLVGLSYGGFVGYSAAAQFPDRVERVVICSAGVCLEEKDLKEGLFPVADLDEAASILLPQTPEKLRMLVRLSFVKPARTMPSCFLRDFIDVMCTEYINEKRELLQAIIRDRKLSELPKITQPTLIIWGDQDQIFPLELAHRLKSHLGENAQLVVIRNAGHAANMEKAKEFYRHLKAFLIDSLPLPSSPLNQNKVE